LHIHNWLEMHVMRLEMKTLLEPKAVPADPMPELLPLPRKMK
jgi:hypothetical protein